MHNSNYFALLVGIDKYKDENLLPLKYAEKDCTDLFTLLSDKEIGLFPPKQILRLLGQDARRDTIHKALRDVLNRSITDTVLIYFSGHAVSVNNEVYFLPSDVSLQDIDNDPFIYLSLRRMREEIFQKSQAKNIVIILDTCSSGSSFPSERGPSDPLYVQNEIVKTLRMEPDPEGRFSRSLLVSSPPNVPSRELPKLRNGLFTYYLLQGMRHAAVNPETGEVTVDSLADYIKNISEFDKQPPGIYSISYTRLVFTKPSAGKAHTEHLTSFPEPEITDSTQYPSLEIFANPLESYRQFIDSFVANLRDYSVSLPLAKQRVMRSIRMATGAELAVLSVKKPNGWLPDLIDCDDNLQSEPLLSRIIPDSIGAMRSLETKKTRDGDGKVVVGINVIGMGYQANNTGNPKQVILIALTHFPEQQVLILYGEIDKLTFYQNDNFSQIIRGIFKGLQEIPSAHPERMEAFIYDWLRTQYDFVPKSFYDHRERLFLNRLKNMTVRFQPIINIESEQAYIDGFEALANDPETHRTPLDIMKSAEIWGTRFMISLDSHIFNIATTNYLEQLRMTPGRRRPEDVLDLSINVYPESLIRTKYFQNVKTVMANNKLPRRKLFLEISEKSIFPAVIPGEGIADKNTKSFRDILRKYVNDMGIGFAIDDFGVGRSSVARLADLTPSYLKIDREILFLETAYDTLEFIANFAKKVISQRVLQDVKIVLEGFDEELSKKLSLQKIKALGIDHIQSYIIGLPTERIVRLNEEQRAILMLLTSM